MAVSGFTRRVTDFLEARSLITISPVAGLMELMVAANCRQVPESTFSALMVAPSPVLSPKTRTWSPTLISPKEPGLASLNFAESGA